MALEVSSAHPPVSSDAAPTTFRFAALESRSDLFIAALFVLAALLLFFPFLNRPNQYIYDEVYHGFTAAELAQGNRDAYMFNRPMPADAEKGTAYEWSHPAFAKLPMQVGILLFGDNAFGWRFMEAIWGALGVGLMYGLGRVLFNRTTGVLGAGLLMFEGLWFVQSRTAMNDVYLVSWIMLAFLLFAVYLQTASHRRWLWLLGAGAAIGLGVATKWSALYAFGLLGLVAGLRELRIGLKQPRELPASFLVLVGAFILLPATMYIGSYVQFFVMDWKLSDWWELQKQMRWYHWNLRSPHDWASRWWTWPLLIRPVWYHVGYTSEITIANTFATGNPAVWWAFLPAMFYSLYHWFEGRARLIGLGLAVLGFAGYLLIGSVDTALRSRLGLTEPAIPLPFWGVFFLPAVSFVLAEAWSGRANGIGLGLILLGFFGQWIPWYISPRISFFYHMLPSVPFGVLGIAYALQHLRLPRRVALGYLAVVLAAFVFFYPHWTSWSVPKVYSNLQYWLPTWAPSGQGFWPQQ
jgi:dolichyl-phosphate-mannose--protein O-mannosyl transferase